MGARLQGREIGADHSSSAARTASSPGQVPPNHAWLSCRWTIEIKADKDQEGKQKENKKLAMNNYFSVGEASASRATDPAQESMLL